MYQCYKNLDENLAWLIQKTKGKKVIKKTHRVNVVELTVK